MKRFHYLILFLLLLIASCCQYKQAKTFAECEFKMGTIKDAQLAGVDIGNIHSFAVLGLINTGKITASALQGEMPLSFTLDIIAKNPNKHKAAINQLEWLLVLDDVELFKGSLDERIEIAPNNGKETISLQAKTNLAKFFTQKSTKAIFNLALNIADAGKDDSQVKIKIKPTIKVGKKLMQYPGYITLKKKFESEKK